MQNQTLTLGGNTTGNIYLDGITSINGNTSVTGTLDVSGISTFVGNANLNGGFDVDDVFSVADGGALTTSGNATFNTGIVDINGDLQITDTNIAFDGATTTFTTTGAFSLTPGGSITLGDGGDTTTINTTSLTLDGGNYDNCTLLETDANGLVGCNTSTLSTGTNLWTLSTDGKAITPINETFDFLLGGTSTTSANFGVTGLASNTPVASLAAVPVMV